MLIWIVYIIYVDKGNIMESLKEAEKALKKTMFHKPEPEDAVIHY